MTTVFKSDQTQYQLEFKLGEGLNSNVWRATRFDFAGENPRTVALKLPKDQTAVPFLRREHETLQRINSVHVVRAIAWESFGGEPALALEWIDGVTLRELAQKKKLSIQLRDEVIRQIHQALADVARANTFHGDLQPGNIMVDRDGRVCLIDFASGKTREGLLQATPAFLSPDIRAGADLSLESDHFALKVIREHLLDGFRNLPGHSISAKDFKVAKENSRARAELGRVVANLMDQSSGTQLIANEGTNLKSRPRSFAIAIASAVAAIFVLQLPVFAEDPPLEAPASAKIVITSQSWMQISVNGKMAGFTPLKLTKIRDGVHHVVWMTAKAHGDFKVTVHAGDTVYLTERNSRLEVR